ncbi:uncharacterized protein CANTADRAFT_92572 [Suhomyces tanzawaensis NRRL Y-17324]|uniref:Uncharacterized protein n=1 Tax=Suhomyces tanzawaensis NRRL Y-17324 TaxID=984487 RepID=A0A1E4SBB3_9ASCO|nr:uncharacterized protein CANTADRAFT_92572 [Suhomyces tanzawaensis NRRL Y-17324]ODV76692.1 hypothetical protein CANTADRAFT_92572 [Suhomyces tanzawaensis NRRL Y-17324]
MKKRSKNNGTNVDAGKPNESVEVSKETSVEAGKTKPNESVEVSKESVEAGIIEPKVVAEVAKRTQTMREWSPRNELACSTKGSVIPFLDVQRSNGNKTRTNSLFCYSFTKKTFWAAHKSQKGKGPLANGSDKVIESSQVDSHEHKEIMETGSSDTLDNHYKVHHKDNNENEMPETEVESDGDFKLSFDIQAPEKFDWAESEDDGSSDKFFAYVLVMSNLEAGVKDGIPILDILEDEQFVDLEAGVMNDIPIVDVEEAEDFCRMKSIPIGDEEFKGLEVGGMVDIPIGDAEEAMGLKAGMFDIPLVEEDDTLGQSQTIGKAEVFKINTREIVDFIVLLIVVPLFYLDIGSGIAFAISVFYLSVQPDVEGRTFIPSFFVQEAQDFMDLESGEKHEISSVDVKEAAEFVHLGATADNYHSFVVQCITHFEAYGKDTYSSVDDLNLEHIAYLEGEKLCEKSINIYDGSLHLMGLEAGGKVEPEEEFSDYSMNLEVHKKATDLVEDEPQNFVVMAEDGRVTSLINDDAKDCLELDTAGVVEDLGDVCLKLIKNSVDHGKYSSSDESQDIHLRAREKTEIPRNYGSQDLKLLGANIFASIAPQSSSEVLQNNWKQFRVTEEFYLDNKVHTFALAIQFDEYYFKHFSPLELFLDNSEKDLLTDQECSIETKEELSNHCVKVNSHANHIDSENI